LDGAYALCLPSNVKTRLYYHSVSLPLPTREEQDRIVAKIEALFAQSRTAREMLAAVPDLIDKFRQSVLAAAFRGKLVEHDPEDEPASVLLERIRVERRRRWEEDLHAQGKDPSHYKYKEPEPPDTSNLPELPEGWIWSTVEQTCQRIVDCLHSTPRFKESGYMCVDTNSIKPGQIVLDKVRFVDEVTFHKRNHRMIPQEDDVLFSREGALLGIAARVPANLEFCLGQRMMVFRLGEYVDAKYFENLLNSPLFRSQYLPKISGTASPHLNIGDIRTFAIPLAPLPEQHRIASRINSLFAQADALKTAVTVAHRRLEQVNQTILTRAFRGELVLPNPSDVSAVVEQTRVRNPRSDVASS
jgi:type I restriction enzyme S subunit